MMKNILFMLLGAGISLGASSVEGIFCHRFCNNGPRYNVPHVENGGVETPKEIAKMWVDKLHPIQGDIRGAFFSKKALDQIFENNSDYNGIMCLTGTNDAGALVFIIDGARHPGGVDLHHGGSISNIFVSNCYCPQCCLNSDVKSTLY